MRRAVLAWHRRTMESIRRITGSALWVLSLLGIALVVASVVGTVFDLERVDPPGPGFVYVLLAVGAGAASRALLDEDD